MLPWLEHGKRMRKSPCTLMMKIYNLGDGNVEICIGSRVQTFVFFFSFRNSNHQIQIYPRQDNNIWWTALRPIDNLSVSDEFRQEHGDRFCKWADWSVPQSSPAHKMRFFSSKTIPWCSSDLWKPLKCSADEKNGEELSSESCLQSKQGIIIWGPNLWLLDPQMIMPCYLVSLTRSELKEPIIQKMSWSWN